ncbi:MAG: glycosyltransferase family 4 protein [Candidatus Riflebacteria bacterium]|nr:glycosyltransferase family 4 protein [Candidatus Riflebacteria bacterium]
MERHHEFRGLKYFSFGQTMSYGMIALTYLYHLSKKEKRIAWETILNKEKTEFGITEEFKKIIPKELETFLFSKELDETHSHRIIQTPPEHFQALSDPTRQNIIFTVWETDYLPDEWKPILAGSDKIIVPCQWNKRVFEEGGVKRPISVIPHISEFHGVESDFCGPIPKDVFVFLNVSVWEKRKNLEQLIEAFVKAFPGKKDVMLVLKTSPKDIGKYFIDFWKFRKYLLTPLRTILLKLKFHGLKSQIMVIPENVSSKYMQYLYSRADAYVSLSHAEGFGMGIYESGFYGKPVIATNYGAYLDFLDQENSFLINCRLGQMTPNPWDRKNMQGHFWAFPDLNHAIDLMRYVYFYPSKSKERGKKLKTRVEKDFVTEKITEKFLNFINEPC